MRKINQLSKVLNCKFTKLFFVVCTYMQTLSLFSYADKTELKKNARKVLVAIINLSILLAVIVGILFLLLGFVKFVVANANDDDSARQKAVMMLATGIALLAVMVVIRALKLPRILNDVIDAVGT